MPKLNHPSHDKEVEGDYFSEAEESEHDEEDNENKEDNEENDDKNKKAKKIRVSVRKPQPRLDPTRLCGPRGLKCVMELFENFKPKGDGHEFRDLEIIVSKYEYWAHRLFPKMKFCDVIEKLEKLGEKREIRNLMNTLRLGVSEPTIPEGNDDLVFEDEMMTAKVMNMMKNIESDDENFSEPPIAIESTANKKPISVNDEDDDDLMSTLDFDKIIKESQSKSNKKVIDDDDENEDQILTNLLKV